MSNKKIKTLALSLTFILSTAASAMVKIEIQKETPYPSVTSDGGDISFTRTIVNPENESFDLKTYDYLILPDKNIYALKAIENPTIEENGTLTQTGAFINVPALLPTGAYKYVYSAYNKSTGEISSASFQFRKRINEYTYPSCNEILENGRSVGNGIYTIDPDGEYGQVPEFSVYCDMTHQGGGWTLFAYNKASGLGSEPYMKETTDMTGIENAVLERKRWMALRDNMISGMMFLDDQERSSRISLRKLNNSCRPIYKRKALNDEPYPFKNRNLISLYNYGSKSICKDGYDSTGIWIGVFPLLQQGTRVKFDVWPYGDKRQSKTDHLFFFLK